MNLLFDTSPEEVPDKKKKRQSKKAATPAQPEAVETAKNLPSLEIIGWSEGDYTCDCGGAYFDILDDFRGEWLIECCFCGLKLRRPAIRDAVQASTDFVFFDGRYSGMTVAQVSETTQGVAYIRWCAEKHKSAAVKDACKSWVASVGYAST